VRIRKAERKVTDVNKLNLPNRLFGEFDDDIRKASLEDIGARELSAILESSGTSST
jgi:hypothetical protein